MPDHILGYARYMGCSEAQVMYGGLDDPRGLLEESRIYAVIRVDEHEWYTHLYLADWPDLGFNSVCFEMTD